MNIEDIAFIIEKLSSTEESNSPFGKSIFENWSLEEKKKLLEIYFLFSKKEADIYDLIWENHGCDSWEDIFRDYRRTDLEDKAVGVEIAIKTITEFINNEKEDT